MLYLPILVKLGSTEAKIFEATSLNERDTYAQDRHSHQLLTNDRQHYHREKELELPCFVTLKRLT